MTLEVMYMEGYFYLLRDSEGTEPMLCITETNSNSYKPQDSATWSRKNKGVTIMGVPCPHPVKRSINVKEIKVILPVPNRVIA